MKYCPRCRTPELDDSSRFCRKDGVELIRGIPSGFTSKEDTLPLPGSEFQPQDANPEGEAAQFKTTEIFICPDKWLHKIAETDENSIHRMVRIIGCRIDLLNFNQDIPTIDFIFNVFNGSVYEISINDSIDGHIKFVGQELYMPKKMKDNSAKNISRGGEKFFTILQVLSKEDVTNISPKSDDSAFWFRELILTIEGGEGHPEIKPQRLILNGGITKGGKAFQ